MAARVHARTAMDALAETLPQPLPAPLLVAVTMAPLVDLKTVRSTCKQGET